MFLTSVAILALVGTSMAFQNRDGRSTEVRVFNFLNQAAASGSVGDARLVAGNSTELFTSDIVDVTAGVFGGDFTLFNNVAATKEPSLDFTKFDTDGNNFIDVDVSLTQGGIRDTAAVVCTNQRVFVDQRNTIIITQNVNAEVVPSLCNVADGTCSERADLGTRGTVSFSCDVYTETLASTNDCSSDNVDVYRVDGAPDPQRLSREVSGLLANERAVLQTPALAPAFTDLPEQLTFPDGVDYDVVNTQELFESGTRGARAHDFFWGGDSAPFFDRAQLFTGKVALFNAARRTNEDGTVTLNRVQFVVRSTADVGFGDANAVVHRSDSITVGDATDFAELPVGTYTVQIFDGDDSDLDIFGSRTSSIAATATPLLTRTVTVAADQASLIVLEGSANDVAFGNGLLSTDVMDFALRSADVTETANEVHVVNLVKNTPLTFASPDTECCNFLGAAAVQPGVDNAIEFEATAANAFNAYQTSTLDCPTLAASLIDSNTVSVSGAGAGSCGKEVHFVLGRVRNVEQNVAICSDCTQDVDIVSRLLSDDETNNVATATVTIPTECGCEPLPADKTCDVCFADEFEAVAGSLADIGSNVATILSRVGSATGDLEEDIEDVAKLVEDVEDDVKKVNKNIDKNVADPLEDIETELDEVKSLAKDTLKKVDDRK